MGSRFNHTELYSFLRDNETIEDKIEIKIHHEVFEGEVNAINYIYDTIDSDIYKDALLKVKETYIKEGYMPINYYFSIMREIEIYTCGRVRFDQYDDNDDYFYCLFFKPIEDENGEITTEWNTEGIVEFELRYADNKEEI